MLEIPTAIPASLAKLLAAKRVLITGTDTDVGKTHVSCALLDAVRRMGKSAIGIKPIASGSAANAKFASRMVNADVLNLRAHSSNPNADYRLHNWCSLEPAIAPHIAARHDQSAPKIDALLDWVNQHRAEDFVLIEGAGGFCSPLWPLASDHNWAANFEHADLAKATGAGVVMVVGLRLGCIHQARGTQAMIQALASDNYLGWIANQLSADMPSFDANLQTLIAYLGAPIATMAYGAPQLEFA